MTNAAKLPGRKEGETTSPERARTTYTSVLYVCAKRKGN